MAVHPLVPPARRSVIAFVAAVVLLGCGVIGQSLSAIRESPVNGYFALLALLTIASGRFSIKVPGRPATVSVSEVFVFTAVLLFGPAAATLIVAVDGLWASLLQEDRRLYRALFNVAEPAISTWCAGHAFIAISGAGGLLAGTGGTVVAALAMAAAFFVLNSGLTAIAIGLDTRTPPYEIWRRHARYLAANYYAAASLAALAVGGGGSLDVAVVALIVPLLIVSYLAYQQAANRVDEAQHHVDEVGRLYQAATDMLAIAVDTKDQVTHGHIRRVQRQTVALARALGVHDPGELKAIEAGALLHDIGKLAVPDYVLNKPSALTRAEFDTIKKHPALGARILTAVDFPYPVVPIVRHHHEQWNGRGYPDGLSGKEIPLGARIIAVVDCYDALTSDRPYRTRLQVDRAIQLLESRKGTYYDPAVVDGFIQILPALEAGDAASEERLPGSHRIGGEIERSPLERLPGQDGGPLRTTVSSRTRLLIDQAAARIRGAEACLFALSAERDVLLVVHATSGLQHLVAGLHIAAGTGVSGWVAANRSTIRQAEAALDLGRAAAQAGIGSCTSSPVFVGGDVFGAVTIYRAAAADDDVTPVVGALALEVGLALSRPGDAVSDSGFSQMFSGAAYTRRIGPVN